MVKLAVMGIHLQLAMSFPLAEASVLSDVEVYDLTNKMKPVEQSDRRDRRRSYG